MTVTVFILFVIILTGWFSVTDLPVALAPAGTCTLWPDGSVSRE